MTASLGERSELHVQGQPPRPLQLTKGIPDCVECADYLFGGGVMLAEATASVAIEAGGNPAQMLRDFLPACHDRDHEQLADG